jgi:hypothetical protein
MITTRLTTDFGTARATPSTLAEVAPTGRLNSHVVVEKTDALELPEVCAAANVVSVLVVRSGRVAAGARKVIELVAPFTVIEGQVVFGVMTRAMA